MILTIEIGNTNIVAGCCKDDKMIFVERLSTHIRQTALEYAVSFKNILELYEIGAEKINGCIISSVVPSETPVVREALEKIIHKKVMV
ncbi:MAG: type III pantothenate kinase, partial [Porcipelethomonas sp.]